jgi:hypothetical protein
MKKRRNHSFSLEGSYMLNQGCNVLTELDVLMSMLDLRCSSTLSRCPALAARRNAVFPSDCKEENNIKPPSTEIKIYVVSKTAREYS